MKIRYMKDKTIKSIMWRNFNSFFICILTVMLNWKKKNFDMNIRPMSRTIDKGKFFI